MDVAGLMATLSEADSYKVQFAVHDRFAADGDPVVGWKVALSVPAQYERSSSRVRCSPRSTGAACARAARCSRRLADQARHRARTGGAHRQGRPCEWRAGGTPYTADSIRAYIANLYCGMEVVDNRYADVTKMSGPARIADNVLQAALVTGTEIKDWQKLDFPNLKGRSLLGAAELAKGPGSAVMGSAMISLAGSPTRSTSTARC